MPYLPYLYEFSPLYLAQAALTVWMLVDANRRGAEYYWFWLILAFQPFGAWAYFFSYKWRDFGGGNAPAWLSGLFTRRPSMDELRHRAERFGTVATHLELGERLVEVGEFAEAVPHIGVMLAREPDHCQALFLMAEAERGLGHPEQSIALLQKLLNRQPAWGNYRAWRSLIETQERHGDLPGAIASCRGLLRLCPTLECCCLLAAHLIESGDKVAAAEALEQGLDDYRYLRGPQRRRQSRWATKANQLLKQLE
jgi:hypothetical protein